MVINDALKGKLQQEIQDLASSINGIVETFRSMRSPLAETKEQVPQATIQLDKIANQTEEAAHLMLDKIEQITQREEKIIQEMTDLPNKATGKLSADQAPLADLINMSKENLDDVYLVMDALQFQDITSQQIQYAAAMLEEIEGKLNRLVGIVNGHDLSEAEEKAEAAPATKRVFDPHADFVDRKADQSDVDSMFDKVNK